MCRTSVHFLIQILHDHHVCIMNKSANKNADNLRWTATIKFPWLHKFPDLTLNVGLFSDFSLTLAEFPDISTNSRKMVTPFIVSADDPCHRYVIQGRSNFVAAYSIFSYNLRTLNISFTIIFNKGSAWCLKSYKRHGPIQNVWKCTLLWPVVIKWASEVWRPTRQHTTGYFGVKNIIKKRKHIITIIIIITTIIIIIKNITLIEQCISNHGR